MLRVSVAVLILLSHMSSQISCRNLLQATSEESTSPDGSGSTSHGSSTSGIGSGTSEGSTASGTNTCSPGEIFNSDELYPNPPNRIALAPMDIKYQEKSVETESTIPKCRDPNNNAPNILASCPWEYVDDYDALRLPQVIRKTRCLPSRCDTCELGKECQEITHPMKVWRKGSCVNGHQIYDMDTIRIPVACVCMRVM